MKNKQTDLKKEAKYMTKIRPRKVQDENEVQETVYMSKNEHFIKTAGYGVHALPRSSILSIPKPNEQEVDWKQNLTISYRLFQTKLQQRIVFAALTDDTGPTCRRQKSVHSFDFLCQYSRRLCWNSCLLFLRQPEIGELASELTVEAKREGGKLFPLIEACSLLVSLCSSLF